jgi:two-component system cell cycle sensor histidine kinase/response regulator CckA
MVAMGDADELQHVTRERDLAVERFVLMCKAMNQCMWDWDIRANVAWYSEAVYSTFGIDRSITPSFERWTTYVHPEDNERVVSGFREVVEKGKAEWTDEYRFVRPSDGAVLEVFDRGFVMFEDGRPVRIVGIVMDVTQQRAVERKMRHAQKMHALGQLAGGIAHDFNNMLQIAKLELDLLRATSNDPVQVLSHAQEIGVAVDRAASLTRQLLMFSRLEAMRAHALDLNAKVNELATMLRRVLGGNLTLGLQLTSGTVCVEADASMLDQVLVNLAVNARDAMADGGTLSIETSRCELLEPSARPAGRYVCVAVRDSGAGISADVLPRIFDPFFTTKPSGTGLGLATVFGIVERHRGWIDVESEVGRGTTFRVYLPEHDGDAKCEAEASARCTPRGRETILLVEDDDGVRRALSTLLQNHGYDGIVADAGPAALAAWETAGGKIDLVIADLMMPGMTGAQLASMLVERRPDLSVLLMSGQVRELDAGTAAGCTLLHKPFDSETLLATVRGCIDRGA